MKRCLSLIILIVWLGIVSPSQAQEAPDLMPGDWVYVDQDIVQVYMQPSMSSVVVEELPRGMISQVVASQTDDNGLEWYYLRDNAFGWVPGIVDGVSPLVVYDEVADLDQLIERATAALTANPDDDASYFWRGILYHSLKQNEHAFSDVTQAIGLNPTNALYYDFRAKINLQRNRPESVRLDAQEAINLGRTLPNTYNRLGIAYDDLGQYDLAIETYDQAIGLALDYGLLYSNKAGAYRNMGDYSQALELYTQAITTDPLLSLAYIGRSIVYKWMGWYEEALTGYTSAIEVDPYNARAYAYRGVYYEEIENNFQAAREDFETSVQLDPFNADGWIDLGVFYMQFGVLDLAQPALEHAVALNPEHANAAHNLGTVYAYQGMYEQAIEVYSQAVALSNSPQDYLYRGQVYLATGDLENAESDFDVYVNNMDRSSQRAYFNIVGYMMRGSVALYRGDFESAALYYEDAYYVEPDLAVSYSTWFGGWRVTLDRESVLTDLQAQLASDPTNDNLCLQVANMNMELGRWDEALERYDRYLELTSTPSPEVADFAHEIRSLFE